MQMKVGSMLVKHNVITEAQLEEALRNQVIFGGKIGTNLIELGYITADKLAEFLSKNKGVPAATAKHLENIPADVIAILSPDVVKKYQVIPIALEKKRLTVAMVDPADFAAIDKLSFMTGMYINAVVIPELLLLMSLERYYKIRRETRYIAIARDMRREPQKVTTEEINEIPAPVARQELEPVEELIEIPGEFDGFDKVETPEPPAEPEPEENYNMTDMCNALAGATSRDAIGEALMEYLRQKYFRCALFLPKEPNLTGWLAAAEEGYIENFSDVKIEMSAPSSFLQVIETKNFCMGQLLNPTDLKAASTVGGKDHPAVLLPIVLMNRVVAILCVFDNLENLAKGLGELQKIAIKSAMAFEILIMRNKIQMV
ncbi:MAG TPA: hypothetical protein VFF53_02665 [Geobacteraceae bacterium]|nr:hypothetical protein [Geobacteraceae bacterium]